MINSIIIWIGTTWLKVKKPVIYFGLILALLALSYLAGQCSTKKERTRQAYNIAAARDSLKRSAITINGLKNSVWEKNAIILGQEQIIEAGLIEREFLKKLHIKALITNTELSGTIRRQDSLLKIQPKTVFITVKDSSGVTRDYARIPFTLLNEHDKFLSLDAGMDSLRKPWYKLEVPFEGSVTVAYKKAGFLKTTAVGIFSTDNQYLQVQKMDVLINKESEKWYQKWWVHAIVGAATIETFHQILK